MRKILVPAVVWIGEVWLIAVWVVEIIWVPVIVTKAIACLIATTSNKLASFVWLLLISRCLRFSFNRSFLFVVWMLDEILGRLDVIFPTRIGSFRRNVGQNHERRIFSSWGAENFHTDCDAFGGDVVVVVEANAIDWSNDRSDDVINLTESALSVVEKQNRVDVEWNWVAKSFNKN